MDDVENAQSAGGAWTTHRTFAVLSSLMTGIVLAYFCWQIINGIPERAPGNSNSRTHLALWAGLLSSVTLYPIIVRRKFHRMLAGSMLTLNFVLSVALVYLATSAIWNG